MFNIFFHHYQWQGTSPDADILKLRILEIVDKKKRKVKFIIVGPPGYRPRPRLPIPIVYFFLTLIKRPLTPPLVLNMHVANNFERLFKTCINACRDKIRQINA